MDREENLKRLSSLEIKPTHPYFLIYVNLIKSINDCLIKYASGKVLDIGCGNKPYKMLLPIKVDEYIGCDIIQSSENCVDIISPADNIPVDSSTFDSIISTQTIEHIGNFTGMLHESFRLLKKDGYLVISGPMYWPLHEEPYDYHRFTKYGFEFELRKVGFEIVEIIPNGGKWALLGQVIFHTLPSYLIRYKLIKLTINKLFHYLDTKNPDYSNTMNYVVVAKKC